MGEKLDNVVIRVKRWIGTCSANSQLQNVKDAVANGKTAIGAARMSSRFLGLNPGIEEKLNAAKGGLDKVSDVIGKADNICMDIKAVAKIHAAVRALDGNRLIYSDPEAAAKAFGSLFEGFGRLASYLPQPAKAFAAILENCGDFFLNVSHGLRPDLRYKKKMRKWEREMRP